MADIVSIEVFLLLVILVILSIALFLLLLIALYVTRLYRRLRPLPSQPRTGAVEQKGNSSASAAPAKSVFPGEAQVADLQPPSVDLGKARDLSSGMELICSVFGLDSLTIATWDGLVVASSGSPSRIEDAALYSRIYQGKGEIEDKSVHLFELDFNGSRLIGIVRRREELVRTWIDALRNDVITLLQAWI